MKHIGRHNNRSVVIIFREVPEEEHMALVTYTDVLPRPIHDDLMGVVESDIGQNSNEISEVLHSRTGYDGRTVLNMIHQEGHIKKVPTSQIIVTHAQNASCRLDELNNVLRKMKEGEKAQQELADLESGRGLKDPARNGLAEEAAQPVGVRNPVYDPKPALELPQANAGDGVLDDTALAQNLLDQATGFENQIKQMLAEAESLREQAYELAPTLKPKRRGRPKKSADKASS